MKPTLIGEGSRRIGVETVALSGAVSTGVNAQVQITETVQVSYYIPRFYLFICCVPVGLGWVVLL